MPCARTESLIDATRNQHTPLIKSTASVFAMIGLVVLKASLSDWLLKRQMESWVGVGRGVTYRGGDALFYKSQLHLCQSLQDRFDATFVFYALKDWMINTHIPDAAKEHRHPDQPLSSLRAGPLLYFSGFPTPGSVPGSVCLWRLLGLSSSPDFTPC